VVVVAVVASRGVTVTVIALCGVAVAITIVTVGGWAVVGPGGRGQQQTVSRREDHGDAVRVAERYGEMARAAGRGTATWHVR